MEESSSTTDEAKKEVPYREAGIYLSVVSGIAFAMPWVIYGLVAVQRLGAGPSASDGSDMGAVIGLVFLFIVSFFLTLGCGAVSLLLLLRGRSRDGAWPSRYLWQPVLLAAAYLMVVGVASILSLA